jgi:hypothetical protein
MARGIFGMRRRTRRKKVKPRCPRRVRIGAGVVIGIARPDCSNRPPVDITIFAVPAGKSQRQPWKRSTTQTSAHSPKVSKSVLQKPAMQSGSSRGAYCPPKKVPVRIGLLQRVRFSARIFDVVSHPFVPYSPHLRAIVGTDVLR